MSGGRWRGNRGRRLAKGLPPRIPWRQVQRENHHQIVYHTNTADPGGATSNTITMHVTYPVEMTFIPPANGYFIGAAGVGPFIWASNTTHSNAFRLVYYGIGDGTNCLQFSANNLDSNTGYVGNGEIMISNSSGVLIHDIDIAGNQWILTPVNVVNTTPTAPTTGNVTVIYYANTIEVPSNKGPNVAFTPAGGLTWHLQHQPGDPFGNQSPPHGYLWVANAAGTEGVSNTLGYDTPATNNQLLYIYRCNSSFNPSANSGPFNANAQLGKGAWDLAARDEAWGPSVSPSGWYRIYTGSSANSDSIFGPNTYGAMWNTSGNATVSNTAI